MIFRALAPLFVNTALNFPRGKDITLKNNPQCTTMRDRKEVWIYLFVYCIDNLIKGYSNYFYISMKNLRSDINVEINTPREH